MTARRAPRPCRGLPLRRQRRDLLDAALVERCQGLADRHAADHEVGRDLHQRHQSEGPLHHARMRDFEVRLGDRLLAIEQYVDIDGARPEPHLAGAVAPEGVFNTEQHVQQLTRRQFGLHRHHQVEIRPLRHRPPGRRLIERGAGDDLQPDPRDQPHGLRHGAGAVAEVRAETQIGDALLDLARAADEEFGRLIFTRHAVWPPSPGRPAHGPPRRRTLDDGAARRDAEHVGGDGAGQALLGLGGDHLADQRLARGAEQQREAEPADFAKPGQRRQILLERLAEADAGVEHDAVGADAGFRRALQRVLEEADDVGDDVDRAVDHRAVVHDDDTGIVGGRDMRHIRIAQQAPDIVEDRRAAAEARPPPPWPSGYRSRPAPRSRRRAPPAPAARAPSPPRVRPGVAAGLVDSAADIDDIRALVDHAPRVGQRIVQRHRAAAIGEAVRRHIEDAHDQRLALIGERAAAGIEYAGGRLWHGGHGDPSKSLH